MTVFDFRQWIESHVPAWFLLIPIAIAVALVVAEYRRK